MADKDRYAEERYDPALASCSSLALRFDGATLTMSGGKVTYTYPSASGQPDAQGTFNYSEAVQMGGAGGPIPAGEYWIRPDELWENAFWKITQSTRGWGNYRISVHPFTTTNTFKRGGFFLHGGTRLGSAGCIDLTKHMDRFVADLLAELSNRTCHIKLTVEYPKNQK